MIGMISSTKLRCIAVAAALLVAASACGHKAPVNVRSAPGASTQGGSVLIPAGTRYDGRLGTPIGSKVSKNGDTFALTSTSRQQSLAGSVVNGHVEDVHAAGPMHKPAMTIVFDNIQLSDGSTHPIDAQLLSMNRFQPKSHHLRTIGLMIGGAVAGHMAAKRTGKRHGALAGAAGGYLLSQTLKTDIYVPAGTVLQLRLNAPVTSGS